MSDSDLQKTERNSDGNLSFEREAVEILQEQRFALSEVLEGLRPPVERPTDLHRLLSLDHKLSWRLFNAAKSDDERALASLIPGRRPMERFLEAALRHGVARDKVDRARTAFERFEQSVARHGAGSRDAFENLVTDVKGGGGMDGRSEESLSASAQARHKRNMFRAASMLFGRQARVSLGVLIVHPSETPGLVDSAAIKGMAGLHRTRRGVALATMVHHFRFRMRGDPAHHGVPVPLDPRETDEYSVGLLRDFCSQPAPIFRPESAGEDYTSLEMVADGVGASAEVTYFIGNICRGAEAAPGSAPGAETVLTKGFDMPVEVDYADVFMHQSIWDERADGLPDVKVYKWPALGWSAPLRKSDLLPLTERATCLGRGPYAGRTPHLPQYEEMISYVIDRAGWNPAEFQLFRCQVDHPMVHTRLRMAFAR